MNRIFFLISFSIFIFSCSEKTTDIKPQMQQFPSKIGATSTYDYSIDTSGRALNYFGNGIITERIADTITLSGKLAQEHKTDIAYFFSGLNSTDTSKYFIENGSTRWSYLKSFNDIIGGGLINTVIHTFGFNEGWYPYLNYSVGIGKSYKIFSRDTVYIDLGGNIDTLLVEASGKVNGNESITLFGTTYETTRLTVTINVSYLAQNGNSFYTILAPPITQTYWCANNFGVVKKESYSTIKLPNGASFPSQKEELSGFVGN